MRRLDWVLLAVFIAPFFVALGDSSIWDSNEAFYTQTPREMLASGDWVAPQFNGRPRLNKPPLSYWIVALFYRAFGVSVYWERFAMALLAAGSIAAVFKLGTTLFDASTALLGAGIFATTFRFVILSRRLLIDILLLFCLLAALACLAAWLREGRRSTFLWAIFFVGCGFLAKGPLAFFPLALLPLYCSFGKRPKWRGIPLGWAALALTAICLPWFLALGLQSGWSSVSDFFLRENLGRLTALDYGPQRGPLYYCGVFLADFFPWSVLFLAACFWWLRGGRKESTPEERQSAWLLGLWIAAWFVLFSLSRNKQEYYILPLYPAAALWVAHYCRRQRVSSLFGLASGVPLALAAAGLFLVSGQLFSDAQGLWIPPFILVSFPVWASKRYWLAASATLSLFFAASFLIYLVPLEAYRPVAPLARTMESLEKSRGTPMDAGYYRFAAPSLAFYLNRPIAEIHELREAVEFLETHRFPALIVERRDLPELEAEVRFPLRVVAGGPVLSTNSKALLAAWRSGRSFGAQNWTREVLLVTKDSP